MTSKDNVGAKGPRVLVKLGKSEEANGAGKVVLTYQCARPANRKGGEIKAQEPERYFETEELPYKTVEECEELTKKYGKELRELPKT